MGNFIEYINTLKLKMASWLSTIYLIGTFTCLILHQMGYEMDSTILSILATGSVGIITHLLNGNSRKNDENKKEIDYLIKKHTDETIIDRK